MRELKLSFVDFEETNVSWLATRNRSDEIDLPWRRGGGDVSVLSRSVEKWVRKQLEKA